MKICPYCAHSNREGMLFCEDCGEILSNNSVNPTSTRQLDGNSSDLLGKSNWGTARFSQEASIILHIRDTADPIVLEPSDETTLGRGDAAQNTSPSLDLTPLGPHDKSASRRHAAIRRGEETLT